MGEFFLGIMEITIGMSILILLMLFTLKLIGGKFTAKCRYVLWTLVMIRLAVPLSFGILPALIEVPVETEQVQQIQMQVPTVNHTPTQQNPITVQPQEQMIMEVEQESYPAGAKEIAVRLINAGDSDYTFTNEDFGIEQFGDGFVSMTPFSKDSPAAQNGMTLAPDTCEMWTLTLSDFSGLELQTGEYAVYLAGVEARFKVT